MREIKDDQSLIIFGKDVTKIPCFRNSFLYGIYGGIAVGLARFMFTSRPKSALDFAVGSFAMVTMAYWGHCRYEYTKAKFEMDRTRFLVEQQMLFEGTVIEKETKLKAANEPKEA